MDDNKLLNKQVKNINNMFLQRVCEKHEYITITQTTTIQKGATVEIMASSSWLQCKHCGYIINNNLYETGSINYGMLNDFSIYYEQKPFCEIIGKVKFNS